MSALHMTGTHSPRSPDTDQASLSYSPSSTVNAGDATSSANSPCNSVNSELRLGKMHLVDLAGSERVTLSGAEGDTLIETQNINLSLTAIGDVLSALSRNATIIHQQQNQQLQSSKSTNSLRTGPVGGSGPGVTRNQVSLVPVPYRNSKLTHLLKDSLGGNSKTIMIATIRTHSEYYQQTAVTLMYASRAKKVRNRSLINRNVIGDTGIHAVTTEIERLRSRLDERSTEFEHLKHTQMRDSNENNALKSRFQLLKDANEREKKQLENQMSHLIHSQAGQLATQRLKSQTLQQGLQEELAASQERIAKQEKEIQWLKRALESNAKEKQHPLEQMERMQRALDAFQSQASSNQKELETVLHQAEVIRSRNETLTKELTLSRGTARQLRDELAERADESSLIAVEVCAI